MPQDENNTRPFYQELISSIIKRRISKQELSNFKMELCRKYRIKEMPTDISILMHAEDNFKKVLPFLQTKPTRTGSGVAVIAVMTRPHKCPHGKCAMCPGGPGSSFGDVPQSYTGKEPATLRAIRNCYDPYLQVFNRLEQYVVLGQMPEKAEVIIMGGTFPALPKKYQEEFVMYCFKAMNDFSRLFFRKGKLDILRFKKFFLLPGKVGDENRSSTLKTRILEKKQKSNLFHEHKRNEKSKVKCVGLTVETRPDYGMLTHGISLLKLGCTRIELGIQSTSECALRLICRGHTVKDSLKSVEELRDLGYKLNFHIMPGILGLEEDRRMFRELFQNDGWKPDMLKIYPLMVMPGTKMHKLWKKGLFKPIDTAEAVRRITELKSLVPEYCRIMRVQRDIPSTLASAGVDKTNLRQEIQAITKCRCIRCREAKMITGRPELKIMQYAASGGHEFFISLEANDRIVGFCRLRFPKIGDFALVRELHVYSKALGIGKKPEKGELQHKGYGKKLMRKAEKIAGRHYRKIAVISGVGVRDYYRKLGYRKQGVYMVKQLSVE